MCTQYKSRSCHSKVLESCQLYVTLLGHLVTRSVILFENVKIITSGNIEDEIKHHFPGQPVLASQVDPGPQVVIVQVEIFHSSVSPCN